MPTPHRDYYPVLLFEDITDFKDYPLAVASGSTTFDQLSWAAGKFSDKLPSYLWDMNWRGASSAQNMIAAGPPITARVTVRVLLIFRQNVGVVHDYILRDEEVPMFFLVPNWRSLTDKETQTTAELNLTPYPFVTQLIGTGANALSAQDTTGLDEGFGILMPQLQKMATIVPGDSHGLEGEVKPNDFDAVHNNKHWQVYPKDSYLKAQITSGIYYAGFPPQLKYFPSVVDAGIDPFAAWLWGYGFMVVDPAVCNWLRLAWLWTDGGQKDFRCTYSGIDGDFYKKLPVLMRPPIPGSIERNPGEEAPRYMARPWGFEIDVPGVDPQGDGFDSRADGYYYLPSAHATSSKLRGWGDPDGGTRFSLRDATVAARATLSALPSNYNNTVYALIGQPFDDTGYDRSFQVHGLLT